MNDKPNLDLLRSAAVIFVVAAHTMTAMNTGVWHGFSFLEFAPFGVYLFFVHTSLVLMWSLERRPNTLDFYIRRAFRLYPLAIVAVLVAAVTRAPVGFVEAGHFVAYPPTLYNIIASSALVNGMLGHGKLLLGTIWSLSPEMFMYILLPALFFYARSIRKIWPVFLIWLLVVLLDRRLYRPEEASAFGSLVPDFIAGVIAYIGFMRRRETLPSWILLPCIFALFFFTKYIYIPTWRSSWFACLAIALLLPRIRQMTSKPAIFVTHNIAKYSYGIYLFHLFTVCLGVYLLPNSPRILQIALVLIPLAPIVVLAYHFIEKPMIKLGAKLAAKWAHERGLPSENSLENLEPAP